MVTYAPHGKFVQLVPITVTNWASFCPVGTNPIAPLITYLYAIDDSGRVWWHDATGWVEYPDPGGVVSPSLSHEHSTGEPK